MTISISYPSYEYETQQNMIYENYMLIDGELMSFDGVTIPNTDEDRLPMGIVPVYFALATAALRKKSKGIAESNCHQQINNLL